MAGPDAVLSIVLVLIALGILLYANTAERMVWITFGFTAGAISLILRPVDDVTSAELSIIALFLAGIVASTGYFMSAYRSWQELRQTEEAEESGRVELE